MKELSIEEKAKRYDSAIKRAKNTIEVNQTIPDIVDCVKSLFPELAKSEDERIRNFISNELTCLRATEGKGSDRYEELTNAIAWLEKQGEHDIFLDKIQIGDKVTRNQDGVLVNLSQLQRVAKKDEKQGEPTEINPSEFDSQLNRLLKQFESLPKKDLASSLSFYLNVVQNDGEPKLKVGEWIIFNENHNSVYQVERIDNYRYYLRHYLGGILSVHFDNELIRKWTIQDAKDGDVLCTYECDKPKIVFILKGTPKKHYALSYHCYYNIMYPHFESDSENGCLAPKDEDVKPATKEQRELLFTKMKESGYEWNADKKELKKIENKNLLLSDFFKAEYERGKTDAQKSSWSEEDEVMFRTAKKIIFESDDCSDGTSNKVIDWLKFLKNRVQPKQEWSEEDEKYLKLAIENFQMLGNSFLTAWLKSLKDRYTWKPSDKQIYALRAVVNELKHSDNKYQETIEDLYNDLEKLREG